LFEAGEGVEGARVVAGFFPRATDVEEQLRAT
jgi:hypothetical protein